MLCVFTSLYISFSDDCVSVPFFTFLSPITAPSSANQCTLGNVYLKSNLSRNDCASEGAELSRSCLLSLVDWISNTHPRGYTDLQSLVKCLDHRCYDRASMQSCKAVLGCAMHRACFVQVPEDPAQVIEELQKAKLPAAPRKVARKRVALPPKESKKRKRAVNLATATNQHMPELFAGAMPVQID